MVKATLLELKKQKTKKGSVPIISEPTSVAWIQLSFPTSCNKQKKMEVYKMKEKNKNKNKLKKLI